MENFLLTIFLILFAGRIILRTALRQLNISHLRRHGREIPAVFQGIIDENTLDKMVNYTVDNSRLGTKESIADDIFELIVLFIIMPVLVSALIGWQLPFIVQALIFFGLIFALGGTLSIPFELYRTFVVEEKYGFSTITWRLWLTDLIKSLIISAVLLCIVLSAFMAFVLYLPKSWWFWAWAFFSLFQLLMLWLYPVVIAPLFNKYEPIQDENLRQQIKLLLEKAGLEASGIYQVDEGKRSRHSNAYFTGVGKAKRIVLFDTLLASHSADEILAVLAHEIGHFKKKHILKQLIFMSGASLIGFYLVYLIVGEAVLYHAFNLQQTPIYAGFFIVSVYISCIGFLFSPIGAGIVRRFEREADRMAVEMTGTSRHLVGALKRLAKDNLANLHPHPWYVWFYYSHPPLLRRIEYLQAMDSKKDL